jgi:hypothetical protein
MAAPKYKKGVALLKTKRGNQIKAGVSDVKYNVGAKARLAPAKSTVARGKPNPWAPKYTWAPWGTKGVVHDNCYDYAFGSFSDNRTSKSIPGGRARLSSNSLSFKTCDGIAKRLSLIHI